MSKTPSPTVTSLRIDTADTAINIINELVSALDICIASTSAFESCIRAGKYDSVITGAQYMREGIFAILQRIKDKYGEKLSPEEEANLKAFATEKILKGQMAGVGVADVKEEKVIKPNAKGTTTLQ